MEIKKSGLMSNDRKFELWYIFDAESLVIAEFYFPVNRTKELEEFLAR